jgi:hypothetical protein
MRFHGWMNGNGNGWGAGLLGSAFPVATQCEALAPPLTPSCCRAHTRARRPVRHDNKKQHKQENSVANPRFRNQRDNVDTVVDPSEFRDLLRDALALLSWPT